VCFACHPTACRSLPAAPFHIRRFWIFYRFYHDHDTFLVSKHVPCTRSLLQSSMVISELCMRLFRYFDILPGILTCSLGMPNTTNINYMTRNMGREGATIRNGCHTRLYCIFQEVVCSAIVPVSVCFLAVTLLRYYHQITLNCKSD
jgi:hypothetical protein